MFTSKGKDTTEISNSNQERLSTHSHFEEKYNLSAASRKAIFSLHKLKNKFGNSIDSKHKRSVTKGESQQDITNMVSDFGVGSPKEDYDMYRVSNTTKKHDVHAVSAKNINYRTPSQNTTNEKDQTSFKELKSKLSHFFGGQKKSKN